MKKLVKCFCPLSGLKYEKELTDLQIKSLTEVRGRFFLVHGDVLKKHSKKQMLTIKSYGNKEKEIKQIKKPSRRKKKNEVTTRS